MLTSCNFGSLAVYSPTEEKPWNKQRANHLYRRLAYGASPDLISLALERTPESIVDVLVDEALNTPLTSQPDWTFTTKNEVEAQGLVFDDVNDVNRNNWYLQTVTDQLNNSLRALLTIFWHNHFVTEYREYKCAGYMVEYYNVLQQHSLGNFKDFVHEVGLTNAMLTYLNGVDNKENRPNDNYARELYELFTLGADNGYTEDDILETAKALTGYNNKNNENPLDPDNNNACTVITFSEETFNTDTKTIFGRSGNFGYDDVIDVLFEEKASLIAEFIVGKLYAFFVSPTLNTDVVSQLASEFQVDFEIEPILRKLFKSEHFFDDEAIGSIIKSPYDIQINLVKVANFDVTDEERFNIFEQNAEIGQQFFSPVDVAGWQADFDWVNSTTLVGRWFYLMNKISSVNDTDPEKLREFAKKVSDNSTDVEVVVRSIVDIFMPRGLNTEADYQVAIDDFKAEVPEIYFEDGTWNLDFETVPDQMVLLLHFLVTLPEFQLK